MRVVILTDLDQGRNRPGVRRRVGHLADWASVEQASCEAASIVRQGFPGRAGRLMLALSGDALPHQALRAADLIIVEALAAPHMTMIAARLHHAGLPVVVDVCDSVKALARSRWHSRSSWASRAIGLVGPLALGALPPAVPTTYISSADVEGDRHRDRRERFVIPPSVDAELTALEPLVGRVDEVVIPVDLSAIHNREDFLTLMAELGSGGPSSRVPVTLYGPQAPDMRLPDNVTYAGWATSLGGIYERRCLVVAPGRSTSGVQNKIWDGVCAKRPLVAHAASLAWCPDIRSVTRVLDGQSMKVAIDVALSKSYCPEDYLDRDGAAFPSPPAASDLVRAAQEGRRQRTRAPRKRVL